MSPEAELELAAQWMRIHADSVHVGQAVGGGQQQVWPEKVQRPKLVVKDGYVTDEAFDYFEHAWREYKILASVNTAVKQHLSSCLGEEVSTMVYNTYGEMGYDALDEAALLKAARGLVVKTRNKLVIQLKLKNMI